MYGYERVIIWIGIVAGIIFSIKWVYKNAFSHYEFKTKDMCLNAVKKYGICLAFINEELQYLSILSQSKLKCPRYGNIIHFLLNITVLLYTESLTLVIHNH